MWPCNRSVLKAECSVGGSDAGSGGRHSNGTSQCVRPWCSNPGWRVGPVLHSCGHASVVGQRRERLTTWQSHFCCPASSGVLWMNMTDPACVSVCPQGSICQPNLCCTWREHTLRGLTLYPCMHCWPAYMPSIVYSTVLSCHSVQYTIKLWLTIVQGMH